MLISAAVYKPFDRSELLVLQYLVMEEHAQVFKAARIRNKVRWLCTSMGHRMDCIVATTYAEYNVYRNGLKRKFNEAIIKCIRVFRVSLTRKRWECPVGHMFRESQTRQQLNNPTSHVCIMQSKVSLLYHLERTSSH